MAVSLQFCINQLAQACSEMGVENAIISPGSRNAPLTVAFARHPNINCKSIIDERSAGFVALGIAKQTNKPVAIICTSGTAVLNYYPAIAEAYYQNIPLIVLTADRPPEWIDQWDGQTIRQKDVFENHIKASYNLNTDKVTDGLIDEVIRITQIAVNKAQVDVKGPVHINVPFSEPFYPDGNESYKKIGMEPISLQNKKTDYTELVSICSQSSKVLVVNGANKPDENLSNALKGLKNIVVLSDVISNQLEAQTIQNWEQVLTKADDKLKALLQAELLITTGKSVVSKNLKLFLRKFKPANHFHISEDGQIADPFETNPELIIGKPNEVLGKLKTNKSDYTNHWQTVADIIATGVQSYIEATEFSELSSANSILKNIPSNSILHLANSMPVRYVNTVGVELKGIEVYSNRGTSGIDGCTSTAVGAAMATDKMATLITGDVAFFYDANGLWNKHLPDNLRIIVMNNGGGGIFRLIDGPSKLKELEEFFETEHNRTAEGLANEHDLEYYCSRNLEDLEKQLQEFFVEKKRPAILEVFTDKYINQAVFKGYKDVINGIKI